MKAKAKAMTARASNLTPSTSPSDWVRTGQVARRPLAQLRAAWAGQYIGRKVPWPCSLQARQRRRPARLQQHQLAVQGGVAGANLSWRQSSAGHAWARRRNCASHRSSAQCSAVQCKRTGASAGGYGAHGRQRATSHYSGSLPPQPPSPQHIAPAASGLRHCSRCCECMCSPSLIARL